MPADDLLLRIAAAFNPSGVKAARDEVSGLGRYVQGVRPELDIDAGGALAEVAGVRTALAGVGDEQVALTADASDALGEVGGVRTALAGIGDEDALIRADAGDALDAVGSVRTALAGIPDEQVAIRIAAPDAGAATSALGDLSAEVQGVGAASGISEGAVGGLAAKVGGLKAGAAGLVGLPVLAWLGGATTGAAELADSVNATNVVFGDSVAAVDKFAANSVTAVGLSERSFRQLAAPIGGLGRSLGFAGEEQARFALDAVVMGADFASVYGGEIPEAVGAVGAAFRGETEPIRRYGISLDDASIKAEAARLGLVSLTVDSRAVAGAQLDVEKAAKAAGAAQREHGAGSLEARDAQLNLAGAQDKLKEALAGDTAEVDKNAKARAVQSLITAQAGDVLGDFANTQDEGVNATRSSSAAFDDAKDKLGAAFVPLVVMAANAVSKLMGAFTSLPPGMQTAIAALIAIGALLGIVAGVVSLVSTVFGGMGAAMLAVFTGPVGIVLLIIAAVAAAVYLIIRNWETIKDFFVGIWEAVSGVFSAAVGWLSDHAGTIARVVLFILTGGLSELVLLFVRNWDRIKEVVGGAIGAVVEFVTSLPGKVIGAVVGAHEWLFNAGRDVLGGMVRGLAAGLGAVLDFFGGLNARIFGALGNIGEWLLNAGQDLIRGFVNGIGKMAGVVKDALLGLLPGPLREFAGKLGLASPSKLFRRHGRDTIAGFVLGIRDMRGRVAGVMAEVAGVAGDLAPVGGLGRSSAAAAYARDTGSTPAPPPAVKIDVHPAAGMDEADLARRVALEQAWANQGRG